LRELWIGVIEVLTEPNDKGGNARAFTNVITWASSAQEYADSVSSVFEEYGWTILGKENVRPVAQESGYDDEITEIIERARSNPKACIYGTFYYYPSRSA
jgi:hypothetical protein